MNELEKRKKLLIAESEVYRQTLKLELQNLRIYTLKTHRKLTSFNVANPLLIFGLPVAASFLGRRLMGLFLGRRRKRAPGLGALALLGWQFYQRLFPPGNRRRRREEPEHSEAEEFLSKRI